MNDITVAQTVLFPDLVARPIVATFDQPDASSDGGAILLPAAERAVGVIGAMAAVMDDARSARRVRHSVHDLLAQRIYGLACGHADAHDADALADDPIHKLVLDRDPIHGTRLASQPTVSRVENAVSPRTLLRLGEALADTVIAHHRRRRRHVRRITIDLDLTEDATHGAQQLALFNGFYGGWCYLPLVAFLTFDDEPRQYLVAAVLRPGTAPAAVGARGVLLRLIPKLWAAFPGTRLRVRLDGGFACPEIFDVLEAADVEYVVAMAKNPVLRTAATDALAAAHQQAETTGASARVFTETTHQARTWAQPRRVVIKAEVVAHPGKPLRENPRFVVTNLRQAPAVVYAQIYAGRGDTENRLKELHHDLAVGRTSCTRFWANQLRVLLSAAAYVLLQELQRHADRTGLAHAQAGRLRLTLLKIGVHVVRSVRRVVLHFPQAHAHATTWRDVALGLGAVAR